MNVSKCALCGGSHIKDIAEGDERATEVLLTLLKGHLLKYWHRQLFIAFEIGYIQKETFKEIEKGV